MLVRRLLLVVAVLMAITAVTVALSPRDEAATTAQERPAATPRSTPDAGTRAGASPAEGDQAGPTDAPVRTMRADGTGQVIRIVPGDELRLRVVADGLETVQLGTDGPIEVADATSPAEFDLLPEEGYAADVRLLESGRSIGRVTTEP